MNVQAQVNSVSSALTTPKKTKITAGNPAPREFVAPIGETGTPGGITSPISSQDFINLYAFERQHQAAHRAAIRQDDGVPIQSYVRIHQNFDEDAKLRPVGGETVTKYRTEDGVQVYREFAAINSLRNGLSVLSGLFGMTQRPTPRLWASPYTAVSAQNKEAMMSIRERTPVSLVSFLRNTQSVFAKSSLSALGPLQLALGELATSLEPLTNTTAFTPRVATSSSVDALKTKITGIAKPSNYSIDILNVPQSHTLRGSPIIPQLELDEAMNLSGTIELNGIEIEIKKTDTPRLIADRINRGEDMNGDGILDDAEDNNYDKEITGGTSTHGVYAFFQDHRLNLTMNTSGPIGLDIQDDDDVLVSLGIMQRDAENFLSFADEVQAPSGTIMRINGREVLADSNLISGEIQGVELTAIKPAKNITLSITEQTSHIEKLLDTTIDLFNSAVISLNESVLTQQGLLESNGKVQGVRTRLLRASTHHPTEMISLSEIGMKTKKDLSSGIRVSLASTQRAFALHQTGTTTASGTQSVRFRGLEAHNAYISNSIAGVFSTDVGNIELNIEELGEALSGLTEETINALGDEQNGWASRTHTASNMATDKTYGDLTEAQRQLEERLENPITFTKNQQRALLAAQMSDDPFLAMSFL